MSEQHLKQPKVLYLAFSTAMFERFGYYIIGFLLTLYLKAVYNYSDTEAFKVFALFTALGYLTPAIGGYLADNVIGIKRCLGLGLLIEGLGFALLAIPHDDPDILRLALAAIIVGAGIFKTAPTNILGRAYNEGDPRIDSGFTLYYMGINVGSLVSSLIAGTVTDAYGWHAPFLIAAVGLFLGFVWFLFFKHYAKGIESKAGEVRYHLWKWAITITASILSIVAVAVLLRYLTIADAAFYVGSALVLLYIGYEIIVSPRDEKVKIFVCLVLISLAVVFFLLYFQLYTSMELFIERNVDRNFFGFQIPTVYFLGLNGLWIIILSPIFASFYKSLRKRGKGIPITTKFPTGILLIALCFFSLTLACTYFSNSGGSISALWIVLAIFLYSAGELLTSALGVAMITHIAPPRVYGIMMGAWYLIGSALAANLSGLVAAWASIPEALLNNFPAMMGVYNDAFWKMGMIGLAAAVIGFILAPWLKRAAQIK